MDRLTRCTPEGWGEQSEPRHFQFIVGVHFIHPNLRAMPSKYLLTKKLSDAANISQVWQSGNGKHSGSEKNRFLNTAQNHYPHSVQLS